MKKLLPILMLLIGLLLGAFTSWRLTASRVANDVVFFLNGKATSDIHMQARVAAEAYFNGAADKALLELSRLLYTYELYAGIPAFHPEEWIEKSVLGRSVTHARLALLYQQLGKTDAYRQHIREALALGRFDNEQELLREIADIDRMHKRMLNEDTGAKETNAASFEFIPKTP